MMMKSNSAPHIPKYCCEPCGIKTDNKKDYNRHLLTSKHKRETEGEPIEIPILPSILIYTCLCNQNFNSRTTLWRHKKQCIQYNKPPINNISIIIEEFDQDIPYQEHEPHIIVSNNENIESVQEDTDDESPVFESQEDELNNTFVSNNYIHGDDDDMPPFFASQDNEPRNTFVSNEYIHGDDDDEPQMSQLMMYKLLEIFFTKMNEIHIESNKEFKQTILDQQAKILDQQATLIELANRPSIVNNNTNNGTITTNVFLNVNCKDAMTFESYLNEIKVEPAHIWLMMKEGSCAGFCEVMKSSMTNIKLTDRPIHCTDAKRDSHWVKYSTGWVKEHENQSIKRVCSRIKHRSGQTVMDIINADPEYKIINTDKHEKMIQLMTAANGTNVSGGQDAIDATIIKYADEKVINLTKEKMMQAIKNDRP